MLSNFGSVLRTITIKLVNKCPQKRLKKKEGTRVGYERAVIIDMSTAYHLIKVQFASKHLNISLARSAAHFRNTLYLLLNITKRTNNSH